MAEAGRAVNRGPSELYARMFQYSNLEFPDEQAAVFSMALSRP